MPKQTECSQNHCLSPPPPPTHTQHMLLSLEVGTRFPGNRETGEFSLKATGGAQGQRRGPMHCLGDKQRPKYLRKRRRRRRRPSISNIPKVVKTGRLRLKVKITEPRVQCREGS